MSTVQGALAVVAASADAPKFSLSDVDQAPIAIEIRCELERITDSTEFDASERNRRFLCYVVEEVLAGRANRIKAYCIATTVFGRTDDFDPQVDPVVRMEAQRLRRSLEHYYLTEGRHSAVRILLPKGGYVPEFRRAACPAAADAGLLASHAARAGGAPSILVMPFDLEADDPGSHGSERGLSYQIMIALSRHARWSVLGIRPDWPADLSGDAEPSPHNAADFVLMGSRAVTEGSMHVKAVLIARQTGRVVWGRCFERPLQSANIFETRDEIANAIARALLRTGLVLGDG